MEGLTRSCVMLRPSLKEAACSAHIMYQTQVRASVLMADHTDMQLKAHEEDSQGHDARLSI